jgi:uncharacterized protein (DUF169 family)
MAITTKALHSLSRLNLSHAPVAIAFLTSPPAGLNHIKHSDAASCGYWSKAASGSAFYTTSDDHQNCPIGAFTHGAPQSPARGAELQGLIDVMVELKYLERDEVPQIPHRTDPLRFAAYAPLADAPFSPDTVLFRGDVRQIMLISEAARRAGVFESASVMGRPACAMLPQSLITGAAVASVGCIGNRVYTGLADTELYITIPGSAVDSVLAEVDAIVDANIELEKFHRARAAQLGNV